MTRDRSTKVHVHLTDTMEKCWTCAEIDPAVCYVGGQTFTLRDEDVGIIACPRCKEKIL